jgi:hypothetical protein
VRVLRPADSPGPRVPDQLQDFPADPPSPASELEPTPPLVLIRWRDAWFDPEQLGADDWRPDYPVQTVGFLVRNDGVVVSVAQEILPDGDGYRAVTHIPAPIITSITVLTEARQGSSNGHGHKNGSNGNGSNGNGSNGNGHLPGV